MYPILLVIMECGALYSMSLLTMLAAYLSASNAIYIVYDIVRLQSLLRASDELTLLQIGQISPITFCLIIVRTVMLRFDDGTSQRLTSARTEASDRLPVGCS